MLQMVKTLAQFTIALEDMRDLGLATASGEPPRSSGADAEEAGESEVRGGEGAARVRGLELSRPGSAGGMGRCWGADQDRGSGTPAA